MNVPGPASPDEVAAAAARTTSWEALAEVARGCTACAELATSRTQVVPGVLPPSAQVLLIGEAPGAEEDAAGVPFVGRSGRLLDELLTEAGLARDDIAVANVLKCRPPGNRTPRRFEQVNCRPWLARQVELAEPRVLVTLGGTATQWALGRDARVRDVRGTVHEFGHRPLVATYHPSAAIRFGPRGVPLAALREDLATVAGLLAGEAGT